MGLEPREHSYESMALRISQDSFPPGQKNQGFRTRAGGTEEIERQLTSVYPDFVRSCKPSLC